MNYHPHQYSYASDNNSRVAPPTDMTTIQQPSHYPYLRNVIHARMNGAGVMPATGHDFFHPPRPSLSSFHRNNMASGASSLQQPSSQAISHRKQRPVEGAGNALYFSHRPSQLEFSNTPVDYRHGYFFTNFYKLFQEDTPAIPPLLLRNPGRKEMGPGKVKVVLRVAGSLENNSMGSWMTIDQRRKQVNLLDPSMMSCESRTRSASALPLAPKMFSFDGIFSPDSSQSEVCSASLVDLVHAVVNGVDGCLISYGHAKLGKTYSVVGCDTSVSHAGLIPSVISWLFRLVNDERDKTGARYSIRLSAVEISGVHETVTDLLADQAHDQGSSNGKFLCDDPRFSSPLLNPNELRANSPEEAARLLDACLTTRRKSGSSSSSHMFFTLHLYQYRIDKSGAGGVSGGRSRLHLIDLGSQAGDLPLSGLGNVILATLNGGQKHVPCKESKITQLLKDALSNVAGHTTLLCHVSSAADKYSETLSVIQMASRVHRMRRKRIRTGVGYGSADSGRLLSSSTSSDPSSSEVSSATTVIFCGKSPLAHDNEMRRLPTAGRIQTNPNLKQMRMPVSSPSLPSRMDHHSVLTLIPPNSPARSMASCSLISREHIEAVVRPRPLPDNHGKPVDSPKRLVPELTARICDENDYQVPIRQVKVSPPVLTRRMNIKVTKQTQARRAPSLGNGGTIDSTKRDMVQKWVELQSPEDEYPSDLRIIEIAEAIVVEESEIPVVTCDVGQQVSQLEILHETHDICTDTPEPPHSTTAMNEYGISQQDLEDLDALDTLASHLSSQLDLLSVELAESFTEEREIADISDIPEPMKTLQIAPWVLMATDPNNYSPNREPKLGTFPRKQTVITNVGSDSYAYNSLKKKVAPVPPSRSSSVPRQIRDPLLSLRPIGKIRSRSAKPIKATTSPMKNTNMFVAPSPDLSHDSGHDSGFSLVSAANTKLTRPQYIAVNSKRSPSQSSSGHGSGSDGNSSVGSANGAVIAADPSTKDLTTSSPQKVALRLADIERRDWKKEEELEKVPSRPKLWTKLPCFGGNKPN